MSLLTLFAEATAPQGGPDGGMGSLPFLMMGLMLLFWVVVVLPQGRRQKKEQEQMLANLKPGAKVVTSAGIVGTVVTVKDGEDDLTIRSADSKIKVLRSTITRVLGEETTEAK